jgi:4'-phosphopantetheinyl transferase EntD
MTDLLLLEAVETAVGTLFPGDVAVAVERISDAGDAGLWPEERAAMTGAVPARLAEFSAGRAAAHRVLAAIGHPAVALPMGADRAPIWPAGIAGSIAHTAGFAIAVARRGRALGVDVEEDARLEPELWPVICSAAELENFPVFDRGILVRRAFAAKEAVFKAQEPGQRAMFGFDAVSVTLAGDRFDARFSTDSGTFRAKQVVRGRLATLYGLVLAGVAL